MNSIEVIEKFLKVNGPSSSSKIKAYLKTKGISDNASRQRISRSIGEREIRKFGIIKLPKNQSFLYLKNQKGSHDFWKSLIESHLEANSAYGIAMQSIIVRGGSIPKSAFIIISGSPQKLKKHLHSDRVLENLISCRLLKIEEDVEFGECVVIDAQGELDYLKIGSLKARLIVDDILVKAVLDWARKIGLGSYEAIQKRTLVEAPSFGHFSWDITAPSGVFPVARIIEKKIKPGFLVIDVTSYPIDLNGLKYFIKKCSAIRSIKTMFPFLAIFIAERFSKEAFSFGKSKGIILTTPEILFGKEVGENIQALLTTLENAAAIAIKDPDRLMKLLNSLSHIEGVAINLRGALFEMIVGHLVFKGEGTSIDIGVKVKDHLGNKAEIDVQRVKGDHEVAIYECKGIQPSSKITYDEIDLWLSKKIQIIRRSLLQQERFKKANMIFEYWISGEFSSDAVELLEKAKAGTEKYKIRWKNGSSVLKYAKKIKLNTMVDVLNQHYLKHPLSKL